MDKNKASHSHYKLLAIASLLWLSSPVVESVGPAKIDPGKGNWELLLNNTGVVAMHMALTHHNTVIMFDQTGAAPSGLHLRRRHNGAPCRALRSDVHDSSCYAHSVEYDVLRNTIRPLDVESDTWGSSGSILSDGTLIQTGGFGPGSRRIRYFKPCGSEHCDWKLGRKLLSVKRWHASSLRLPDNDDRVIVVGGNNVSSYEYVPKRLPGEKSYLLPFLQKTYERNEGGNNLYPIIHLSSDGDLFIFANRDSILFNYKRNKVVKSFPRIPGRGSRSYPSSGSSVILPLSHANNFQKVEVMICGGAPPGAYTSAERGQLLSGLKTCGRMVITGNDHEWKMETMPGSRLMNDMIILPNGNVLIINGVQNGCAGWNYATNPSFQPYLYRPKRNLGMRFSVLRSTKIARMYHSSAILLPDGRVLVAGSNPNNRYRFRNVAHPTELRLQAFVPENMGRAFDDRRAHNVSVGNGMDEEGVGYGKEFVVRFLLKEKRVRRNEVVFSAYAPPFNTHSISMNQRLLILKCNNLVISKDGWWNARVEAPPSATVAPAGYYMLTVVNNGIPSRSQWVRFVHS